jgi:hypothetical protein
MTILLVSNQLLNNDDDDTLKNDVQVHLYQDTKRNKEKKGMPHKSCTSRKIHNVCHQGDESIIALMMKAASTSETLLNLYLLTQHNNLQGDIFIPADMRTSNKL